MKFLVTRTSYISPETSASGKMETIRTTIRMTAKSESQIREILGTIPCDIVEDK